MKTKFLLPVCCLFLAAAHLSCSKSSLIEGVDTPYRYQDYTGYKGWLQVWIKKGGTAGTCDELKIYEGVHYLGKVDKKYLFDDTYKVNCGDGKALQISMPPGNYTIKVSGTCGGATVTKTIKALYCTTLELQ